MQAPTGWPIVGWVTAAIAAMFAILAWQYGLGEEGVRVVLRATARTSVALFLAAFLASSLRRLIRTPLTAWLLRNRRQLGVSFAVSHFVHGWAIVSLLRMGFDADTLTLWVGGLAYVIIAAMTATSFDRTTAWIGPRAWRRLHTGGIWYLWVVFALTYMGTAATDPLAAVSFVALIVALGIRGAARTRTASVPN